MKLHDIQSKLKAPKGQTNKFGGYRYRSCEDILEAVKPLLSKAGCVLTISDEMVEVGGRVYVKASARLTDGELTWITTAFAREPVARKGMDEAQITGASSSYARKYALSGLFCLDDTADPDATNDHGKTSEKGAKTSKKGQTAQKGISMPAEQLKAIWGDLRAVSKHCGMDAYEFLSAELDGDIDKNNVKDLTGDQVLHIREVVAASMKEIHE